MAVLWKPGSAAHCCSGWNFNASHSPSTQEVANLQTKPQQTCRCLIRVLFLDQPIRSAHHPGGGKFEQAKISLDKIETCCTPVSQPPAVPLRIVLEVQRSLVSFLVRSLICCYICATKCSLVAEWLHHREWGCKGLLKKQSKKRSLLLLAHL